MEAYLVTYRDHTERTMRCLDDETAIHLAKSVNSSTEGDQFNGAFDIVKVCPIDPITDVTSDPIYTHE